jgi:hypothetical protein
MRHDRPRSKLSGKPGQGHLNTLLRQEDFIKRVLAHVEKEYKRYSRNKAYFDGALPRAV